MCEEVVKSVEGKSEYIFLIDTLCCVIVRIFNKKMSLDDLSIALKKFIHIDEMKQVYFNYEKKCIKISLLPNMFHPL